jgi:hypothetical protein
MKSLILVSLFAAFIQTSAFAAQLGRTVGVTLEPASEAQLAALNSGGKYLTAGLNGNYAIVNGEKVGLGESRLAVIGEAPGAFLANLVVYKEDPSQNYATVRAASLPVIVETTSLGVQAIASRMLTNKKGFVNFGGLQVRDILGDYYGLEIGADVAGGVSIQLLLNRSGAVISNIDGALGLGAGIAGKKITIKTHDAVSPATLDMGL